MDPLIIVIIVTFLMLFLIATGMPIAFSVGLAGSVGIVFLEDWATLLYTLGSFPVSRVGTFAWAVIPLFILLGNFAEASGLAAGAYSMANKWLSRLKGGAGIGHYRVLWINRRDNRFGSHGNGHNGKNSSPGDAQIRV